MTDAAPTSDRRRGRGFVTALLVVLALSLTGGALMADRRVEQPYPFNHAAHTEEADCSMCHQGVRTRAAAGLPGPVTCAACHTTAPGESPTEDDIAEWNHINEEEPWNRLYRLPEHVFFSHRSHVTFAELDCAECHGEMGERETPPNRPLMALLMRDCIECHTREEVTSDCTACHR